MNIYDVSEQAYKNGYCQGYTDAVKSIIDICNNNKHESVEDIVVHIKELNLIKHFDN